MNGNIQNDIDGTTLLVEDVRKKRRRRFVTVNRIILRRMAQVLYVANVVYGIAIYVDHTGGESYLDAFWRHSENIDGLEIAVKYNSTYRIKYYLRSRPWKN